MAQNTSKQVAEIRRALELPADAPLNNIVRAMVIKQSSLQKIADQAGINSPSLKEYCTLFAKGLQWTHEKYGSPKNMPGPEGLPFSRQGETIKVNVLGCVAEMIVGPVPDLKWINLENPTSKVTVTHLVMTWDHMLHFQNNRENAEGFLLKAKSRAHLGKITMQEITFLGGVEEAYHSIQEQDPEIAARLAKEQAELERRVGNVEKYCKKNNFDLHDVLPRELDVVPILEKALAEYKQKHQRGGPQ